MNKELVEKFKWHEFFDTPLDKDQTLEFLPLSIATACATIAEVEAKNKAIGFAEWKDDNYKLVIGQYMRQYSKDKYGTEERFTTDQLYNLYLSHLEKINNGV